MKLLIFRSTRDVIRTEKTFRAEGLVCRVIPVPRSVSPNCGMALEIDDSYTAKAAEITGRLGVENLVYNRDDVTL